MAKAFAPTLIQIFLIMLSIAMLASSDLDFRPLPFPREEKMTLFLQEFKAGPKVSFEPVAGAPGMPRDHSHFGTVFVVDVLMTEGQSIDSVQVGRAQGITLISSRDTVNAYVLISLVFTNAKHNGSTLEIQGRSIQTAAVRELAVVSGNGGFRFARGYATLETIFIQPTTNYVVVRINITAIIAKWEK